MNPNRLLSRRAYCLAMMMTWLLTPQVDAHAFLDRSDPKVGAVVTTPPTEIKIWFTDDVVPDKSSIQVFTAGGTKIDKRDTHPDPENKSLLTLSLPALSPGTYKVVWHAVCPDTHKTEGTFEFVFQPLPTTRPQ